MPKITSIQNKIVEALPAFKGVTFGSKTREVLKVALDKAAVVFVNCNFVERG